MRAVVLRGGELEVRETADPVAGQGELLIRPLSAALCASDVHYMDNPNSAPRFVWDADRDVVMGHEFIGEVVGHGPGVSDAFPIGARVTSMPLLLGTGDPHVIGHDPDAPGAFGELMRVSEMMTRAVPDTAADDAVAVVDAFAVGEFYVRSSGIGPGELPLVIGAGAIGLSAVAALRSRGIEHIIVADYSPSRLEYARTFGATIVVNPAERSPYEVWRETARDTGATWPQVVFECAGAPGVVQNIVDSCEFGTKIFAAGSWSGVDPLSIPSAMHQGLTIQFGGGPHPQDWYGTLDAVAEGRLDPLPSVGRTITLDEVPEALDHLRKGQGPPRVVVHP
ncbi:zinc-binding dehydrogenase [Nocardia bovistercoris]|uniref:Zinc-binding dehydrogenase n=1 Tax=Nocardia bovistercoris TaxID=2785916 RepID=A0A931N1J0_9NOCA|nr:zinc-binding dehydrogenase [Nocardia bovistercoris]MBH0778445.1 zinc-binding dehydrogenase [Nocardia bovistercoris]